MTASLAVAGELLPAGPVDHGGSSVAGPAEGGVARRPSEPTDAIRPVGQAGQEPTAGPVDPVGQVTADLGRRVERPFPRAGEALQAAVNAVLLGATITEVQGWRTPADEHNPENVSASVDLGPSGEGVSVFFLTGGWGGMSAEEYVNFCPDELEDCQVSTLPDGTLVKTYSQVGVETSTGPWTLYRVDRLVDGVVIGVNASAGRAEDGSVLGQNPPVTMQQLVDIAAHLQPLR